MKKIISIAFAAILAGLAISCQKEELVSDKTDTVQYTFNITVADQVGFDSDASTKGASGPSYKSVWENGDKIFLFFKPAEGSLLGDRYATLTYNGISWVGTVTEGQSNLGNGGTLSAVYVYKLDGSVTPTYSDNKWTIATGNTFYNCQTGVDYTVSGSEISASLNLVAPADFVCFSIYETSNGSLTCDRVTGWKDVVIGGEMTFSNATCTGYMTGINNNYGGQSYQDYYGRIVGGGTSLKGVTCKFSVVKGGKVYERTATPSSDKRSFYMDVRTDGTKPWTVAEGKLPGLFTVGKGADGKAGTADDVKVRFSQGNLYAQKTGDNWTWNFYDEQYKYYSLSTGSSRTADANDVEIDLFTWGYDNTSTNDSYSLNPVNTDGITGHDIEGNKQLNPSTGGDDWGVAYCESNNITVGTWRTLSTAEWQYLFNTRTVNGDIKEGHSYQRATINSDATSVYGMILYPDGYTSQTTAASYTSEEWSSMETAGCVFLPAAGRREGSKVSYVGIYGYYWSSTACSNRNAYRVDFDSSNVYPGSDGYRSYGYSVRLITDASAAAPAPAATTGTAKRTGDIDVKWIQLWENGPKFAEYNVGVTDGKAESYGGYYTWGDNTATNLWGSNWRMPTADELGKKEGDTYVDGLLGKCTVEWIDGNTKKYNNTTVTGLLCTGKGAYASNRVFLPAAGYFYCDDVDGQGRGYYWSSTPDGSNGAFDLYFDSGDQHVDNYALDFGFSVRAVLAEED